MSCVFTLGCAIYAIYSSVLKSWQKHLHLKQSKPLKLTPTHTHTNEAHCQRLCCWLLLLLLLLLLWTGDKQWKVQVNQIVHNYCFNYYYVQCLFPTVARKMKRCTRQRKQKQNNKVSNNKHNSNQSNSNTQIYTNIYTCAWTRSEKKKTRNIVTKYTVNNRAAKLIQSKLRRCCYSVECPNTPAEPNCTSPSHPHI